ncbi:Integrase [Stappia aggregata IAM 12614]|uniref:Integrase n=1 Tax=Roseibium aggregatum (strain ATCC 25650 / DSM 13394 / JCM 20685 / NBRC 16684 / NCIMB 2208 / IAM 12614 / B1) TaxID=384765 RepID=A0P2K9_ROSAI|nr:Integrase [Stappia aggregata IAM 12614] [Roseibium aggregatum IAM 12614]
MDFAEFVTEFTDEPSVYRKVWLFSFVLGNSRWLWGWFCSNQSLERVLRCHVMVFDACGGTTQQNLFDRMKTAVLGDAEDGTVTCNPALVAVLDHYGSAPEAVTGQRLPDAPFNQYKGIRLKQKYAKG